MLPYTATYRSNSLLHNSSVMHVVIIDSCSSAAISHCLLICFSQCDTQDTMYIIQQDCRHMCSKIPPPPPRLYSFLFFYSLWHALIHQTSSSSCSSRECGSVRHIYILCVFIALALNYFTKHHQKRMCV